ncbi:MAG: substrate-binding domain-containing protein [Armatimonadetes bacterium]|nr:substrate-binding domain-containing protein [Armatimonadota bacterium]
MKYSFTSFVAACALLLLAGCSGSGGSGSADGSGAGNTSGSQAGAADKLRIAVIPKGTTHEFWKAIHAGAEDAAKELGVEIIWKGPVKEDDKDGQIKVVESFIDEKVSGIVLAPLDDTALRAPVDAAADAGIPVVIIDSDVKTDKYASFVATDNKKGGQMGGEHLAQLLGGKGKVVMLRYQTGSASTMNREAGFLEAMKASPGITVASEEQQGGATTESAMAASENLIGRFKKPDGSLSIDGIFCPNESTTFGMLRALQDAGLAGKVKFVGFDSSAKLVDGMKGGQVMGLVLQNPYKMGYEGVKTIVAAIKGEKVEKRVDTGVSVITPENMASPESQKLLFPPQPK